MRVGPIARTRKYNARGHLHGRRRARPRPGRRRRVLSRGRVAREALLADDEVEHGRAVLGRALLLAQQPPVRLVVEDVVLVREGVGEGRGAAAARDRGAVGGGAAGRTSYATPVVDLPPCVQR